MNTITVHALIRAKEGRIAEVREAALKLVPLTRAEPGCLRYDLHESLDDPRLFMFFETFKDMAAFETHKNAPYLKDFVHTTLPELTDDFQVTLLKQIA
ncbi:MAG: putative quinol monooxygenase [Verrucomicrobiae bacterium]|nr:putative quinol monooxygenase [Verrucomicrobiae bacterium]